MLNITESSEDCPKWADFGICSEERHAQKCLGELKALGMHLQFLPYSQTSAGLRDGCPLTIALFAQGAEPSLQAKRLIIVCHCMHAGFERDRVMERIARNKVEHRSEQNQDLYLRALLQMDADHHALTTMTQHLSSVAICAYTPQHKDIYDMPPAFGSMLKGKHEIINDIQDSLRLP